MSDVDKISKELSEISITHSAELMELAQDTNQMSEMSDQLAQSADRALAIKTMLEETKPYQVSVSFGSTIDKQLKRIGVIDVMEKTQPGVTGVESLGISLMPRDYLATRIQGCESFIGEAVSKAKKLLISLSENIRDRYILLKESNRTLQRRLLLVENQLASAPKLIHGAAPIALDRNPTLFMVDGQIKEQWGAQLEKVDRTISALMTNYYKNNQSTINELVSYFGGFGRLSEDKAVERLLNIPSLLTPYVFKECLYPYRDLTRDGVKVTQSVELMGGRRFINAIDTRRPKQLTDLDQLDRFLDTTLNNDYVRFITSPKAEINGIPTVGSFSTLEIKVIIKLCYGILNKTESLFSEGDVHTVEGSDYLDIVNVISDNDWDDGLKRKTIRAFERYVLHYNKEMLTNRVDVVEYLTLLINGLLNLCERSINAERA